MAEPPAKKARASSPPSTGGSSAASNVCVEIKDTPAAGRGLFTTRAVAAGETLSSETPALRWVDAALQENVCGWCLCHSAEALTDTCEGCKRVRWCGSACRAAHAAEHGHACKLLAPLKDGSATDEVDALLGLVAGYSALIRGGNTEAVAAVDALCCDVELTAEEDGVCQKVGLHCADEGVSLDRIRKLHRQDKANSFLLPLPTNPNATSGEGGGAASASGGPVGVPEPAATVRFPPHFPAHFQSFPVDSGLVFGAINGIGPSGGHLPGDARHGKSLLLAVRRPRRPARYLPRAASQRHQRRLALLPSPGGPPRGNRGQPIL